VDVSSWKNQANRRSPETLVRTLSLRSWATAIIVPDHKNSSALFMATSGQRDLLSSIFGNRSFRDQRNPAQSSSRLLMRCGIPASTRVSDQRDAKNALRLVEMSAAGRTYRN
jgi:5-formaminoimidazole-4-carboxamide-1-beta-D-ribofuranosyl 5'-monophosphate synthetase